MKKQIGVSMMELVIVIIIIILIATFSVYTGKTVLDQATATEVFEEMKADPEAFFNRMQEKARKSSPSPAPQSGKKFCPNCGNPVSGGKFCAKCGSPV